MEIDHFEFLFLFIVYLGDKKDVGVTKAYESVLILTLRQPDSEEYMDFAEEVKRRAKAMYNYEFGSEESVR